jgi:hypothetical protein
MMYSYNTKFNGYNSVKKYYTTMPISMFSRKLALLLVTVSGFHPPVIQYVRLYAR